MFAPPVVQRLSGGRLHLQHGPIDLVVKAWGSAASVSAAEDAAIAAFSDVLPRLCAERAILARPATETTVVDGPIANRMVAAAVRFAPVFVTPMAGVAGGVADHMLAAMTAAAPLDKAFVNNGGDIAVYAAPGATLDIALAAHGDDGVLPGLFGTLPVSGDDGIGGIATSGRHGRSFSLGIADAVTVIAADAVTADIAATLIANAVTIDSPAISRVPAMRLDPDSDLGDRPVTVDVGPLAGAEVAEALAAGHAVADAYRTAGLITGAVLRLNADSAVSAPALLFGKDVFQSAAA